MRRSGIDGPTADGGAKVFEDRITAGTWRVERMSADGDYEDVKVFTGRAARYQAIRYAARNYGAFAVMRLKPHRRRSIPAQ